MRQSARDVFVGRQAELGILDRALQTARTGRPQVVSLEGEAGIGKTRLLRRFLAAVEDAVVLRASGEETETGLDHGVLQQLLLGPSSQAVGLPDGERSRLLAAGNPFAAGAELLSILGSLQDNGPVVVAVDDVHWMDAPSAGVLLFMLRRLQADRVLVLLAGRGDALGRLGSSWLRLLDDPERVERVHLSGLGTAEVRTLVSALRPGQVASAAERLREHTGGNPLYLRTLLEELPPEAFAARTGPLPAPRSFAAVILTRAAALGEAARGLLGAAAVAGIQCLLTTAAGAAGLADAAAALDEVTEAGLLAPVAGRWPQEVRFTHPLIRAAIYDDLSPSRRRALHVALAGLTSGTPALGHRMAAASGADDDLAAELANSATSQTRAGSLPAAAEHLLWASQLSVDKATADERLLHSVELWLLAGDVPRAAVLLESVGSCADGPHKRYVLAAWKAAIGRLSEAAAELEAVIDGLRPSNGETLLKRAACSLAIVCSTLGRAADAVTWARFGLTVTAESPANDVVARQALADGLALLGHAAEGITLLGPSQPAPAPGPFEPELIQARGRLRLSAGDPRGALTDLAAVVRWGQTGTPIQRLPLAYACLAEAEDQLGRWDDALAHAHIAVSLGQDYVWDLPYLHSVAARLHAVRGEWPVAADHVEATRRAAEALPLPVGTHHACLAAATLAWARCDWDAVLRAVRSGDAALADAPVAGPAASSLRLLEIEALAGLGRHDDAAALLETVDGAPDLPSATLTGAGRLDAWRLRAGRHAAAGRPAAARTAYDHGLLEAEAGVWPLAHALLRQFYGSFLAETGDRREAVAVLHTARQALESIGARPFLERCDLALAACGIAPSARDGGPDYHLTPREQVVARMVASGMTNREVAAELYLSPKAIEYHLHNVFDKIGVRSRRELARILPDRHPRSTAAAGH